MFEIGWIRRASVVLAFLSVVAALATGVWRYGYYQALDQLSRQASSGLTLASDRLTGQLQRYRELAVLMADDPRVAQVLAGDTPALARPMFLEIADKTGALDIVLMDAAGRYSVSASGEELQEEALIPAVTRALRGALGSAHGTWGNRSARATYFAAPVFAHGGQPIGAVVVVTDLVEVEWDWVGSNPAVFFTETTGRVIVTNRSELVFWQRPDNAPGLVPPVGPEAPFNSYYVGPHEVWQVGWGPYLPESALHIARHLPVIDLTGEVLVDVAPARRLALLQAAAVAALCLAFGALLFLATERRRTLAVANAHLERRVAERTAALEATNTTLRREVSDRQEAQNALAKAQAELVEAGKLSALGQMSAGLSHELNQPLMAIQSFAENGQTFLDREKPDKARANLSRISDLATRMDRIIRNLRAFARQESAPAKQTDMRAVLAGVIDLVQPRLAQEEVTLLYDAPAHPLYVRGGEVRLGQVFVNLITNAIDAMRGQPDRRLRIDIEEGATIIIRIRDTGPGLDAAEKVFEPFYTTKSDGAAKGMGLGLSISYGIVQSFGGTIRARNWDEGAQFSVTLERWQDTAEAAE